VAAICRGTGSRAPDNSTTIETQDLPVALEQTVSAAHTQVSKVGGVKLSPAPRTVKALLEVLDRKLISHSRERMSNHVYHHLVED
jgi:hypothetical protein